MLRSRSIAAVAALSFLSVAQFSMAFTPYQGQDPNDPTKGLKLNSLSYKGCFSSPGSLVDQGFYQFQTSGWCQAWCVRNSWPIMAVSNGTDCYCGTQVPTQTTSEDQCQQVICAGFGTDKCGGPNAWMVWDDGYQGSASPVVGPTGSGAPGSTPVQSTTSAVQIASTVFITQAGSTPSPSVIYSNAPPESSSGPNKAAIAAGVVVGLLALLALVGGGFIVMRQRRRKALEEEVRRRESMINFVTGAEKPSISPSLTDARLEPSVMFQRRQSDGSIMDNQDYSRRILKVTNPDDR